MEKQLAGPSAGWPVAVLPPQPSNAKTKTKTKTKIIPITITKNDKEFSKETISRSINGLAILPTVPFNTVDTLECSRTKLQMRQLVTFLHKIITKTCLLQK